MKSANDVRLIPGIKHLKEETAERILQVRISMFESQQELLPLDYPCTTVLIDDDEAFLTSLKRSLSRNFAPLAFSSTTAALQHISDVQDLSEEAFGFFDAYPNNAENADVGDDLILIKSSRLQDFSQSPDRYNVISVAIIDQIMPRVSGVEFCKQLEGTGIKKILLTGQMSDPETIEVFNAGLIHGFVNKNDPDARKKIGELVDKLHHQFLVEKTQHIAKAFDASDRQLMGNFAVRSILMEARKSFAFEEYFYIPSASGFIMTAEDGRQQFCLIASDEEQRELADIFTEDFGDSDQLSDLHDGKVMICSALMSDEEALMSEEMLEQFLFACQHKADLRWCLIPIEKTPFAAASNKAGWASFKSNISTLGINETW